jgi:endoglucanase
VWNANFGYLQKEHRAPVFVGEFGSRLQTNSDQLWLKALVRYIVANHMSFGYWSYNPDSGDTGGLVADNWTTPERAKLRALRPLLGKAVPAPPTSQPPIRKPPAPTPPPAPSPTPAARLSVAWTLQSSWDAGYVAQLSISARRPVRGWSVSWRDPGAVSVVNAWGMRCSVSRPVVHCTGSDWAATIATGGARTVGLQLAHQGPAPTRPRLTFVGR